MAINPPVASGSRKPRAQIKINGDVVDGLIYCRVTNNNLYQADRFDLKLALDKLPDTYGLAFWADKDIAQYTLIDIAFGFATSDDPSGAKSMTNFFSGAVDDFALDLESGIISLSGRDLTGQMIDTKTTDKFANMKIVDIVAAIAARHNLTTAISGGTEVAGRFYDRDHVHLTDETSEWDLLTYLAQQIGYLVYVRGTVLHFEPPPAATAEAYEIHYQPGTVPGGNTVKLRLRRNLTLAKDITVTVLSWDAEKESRIVATVKASNANRKGSGKPQTFSYTVSGLNQQQAYEYGQQRLQELTQHERVIDAELPGDLLLDINQIVKLIGTKSDFDQVYFPDEIQREIDLRTGFRMSLRAKNHSPISIVNI